jgi:hypothetical protein
LDKEVRDMKSKIRIILKTVLTLIAICIILFGGIGFSESGPSRMGNVKIKKYYEQRPLNQKAGIAVDSYGNIYIGDRDKGIIQVYDSMGDFQYGFSFPAVTSSPFVFGIEQDKIHIVIDKRGSYFIFDGGELVSSEKGIDEARMQKLKIQYNMKEDDSFDTSDKNYELSLFNTVIIHDKLSGKNDQVHLNVPISSLPVFVLWVIGAAGMGMVFALHRKFFLFVFKKR